MKFVWEEYEIKKHKELDRWKDKDFSDNSEVINKYAMFNEPLSNSYDYYYNQQKTKDVRILIVKAKSKYIAFVICCFFQEDGKNVLGINPIVVNPQLLNKGYGHKILNELLNHTKEITGWDIDKYYAGIDIGNTASKKLFASFGFKLKKLDEDEKFGYYYVEK